MNPQRSYYERNKELVNARRLARARANPEAERQKCRQYYEKNRDRVLSYKKKHRDKYREEYNAKARAKRAAAAEPASDYMRRKYGITIAEYNEILALQLGVCAICEKAETGGKRFAIDHDHKTGKIRGLLCYACNTSLGRFNDEPSLLESAAAYLRSHANEPN